MAGKQTFITYKKHKSTVMEYLDTLAQNIMKYLDPLWNIYPPLSSCIKGYNCNWRATKLLEQTGL